MEFILPIIILPVIFNVLSRFLNSRANYYLVMTKERDWIIKPIKFIAMGRKRYLLISIFCRENEVAKRVIVFSLLVIANTLFMIASGLITYYLKVKYLPIIFWILGGALIIIMGVTADPYDSSVWTKWGTKKKN